MCVLRNLCLLGHKVVSYVLKEAFFFLMFVTMICVKKFLHITWGEDQVSFLSGCSNPVCWKETFLSPFDYFALPVENQWVIYI